MKKNEEYIVTCIDDTDLNSGVVKIDDMVVFVPNGSLTLAHSQNSQMSFMYGFFFAKFLFYTVVCVVIVI